MQEPGKNAEKPKITGPKPVIACKPKYVPPVNLKCQKDDPRFKNSEYSHKPRAGETSTFYTKGQSFEYRRPDAPSLERQSPYNEVAKSSEKCDKFGNEALPKPDCAQKAPSSPSTVCCSILSNVGNDCCGVIVNPNKKELDGKTMTKMESVDSNSSDSGGFKEFLQRDLMAQGEPKAHQRKASQPDLFEKPPLGRDQMSKSFSHQRQASQPEEIRTSFVQNRQNFIASAQALEQFLPQGDYKMCSPKPLSFERTDDAGLRHLPKVNVAQTSQMLMEKNEEVRGGQVKSKPPLIPHGQFQNTTRKLEEFLAQRLEREKSGRKGCLVDAEGQDVDQKMMLQKQIQQKLQADLQRTVKQIQEIQSIELRLPQNRKWTESNRSQPAIGLKHTPKSRDDEQANAGGVEKFAVMLGQELRRPNRTKLFNVMSGRQLKTIYRICFEMDDPEIKETVEQILGKGAKVVDCEKKSSIKEEEVLLINGIPVTLEGRDGRAIKEALITGQVPPCDLLNTLLIKTGILKAPVKLDTSLSVKSTTVTKEEVTVSRDGKVVDERSRETKEHNFYTSAISEVYEPVRVVPAAELLNGHVKERYSANGTFPVNGKRADCSDHNGYETGSDHKFSSFSSASSYESEGPPRAPLSKDSGHLTNSASSAAKADFTPSSVDSLSSLDEPDFRNDLADRFRRCGPNGNGFRKDCAPTIFGTVASDHTPKDCSNRRSLPQTPQTGKNFSSIYNGEGVSENAANSDLQHDNALVYRDGNLVSGPLEALIQHMVPTDLYYPDRAYLFAFLLSSRLFIKPHDLLSRVRSLCETQQGLGSTTGTTQPGLFRFAEHIVQLLAEWTETFPYDFRDERVMQHVRTITQQCCALSSSLRANVSSLLHNLLQRLTALESYEKFLEDAPLTLDDGTDITEVCPKPEVLAQQLTHVELERLSYIGPEEFVQAFAKENPHIETSFKDMKKTHNLEQYVQWFNRLSYFVATQVIRHLKKKQRVRVVEYWIETGRECFNIGNFNSLMAIIAGLNMSPLSRLKKTWHKIQSGKFAILEHQMDPSSNFSSYRSTLKAAMWRSAGATDQRQRIVIPFFSLLVKDLYFLNQGCSNKLPNGHINFEKFWQLAKQVTEFMAWKQVTCPFEKDPKIIAVLQHGSVLSENALALASFECEQPENNQEKERCKSLKAEGSSA